MQQEKTKINPDIFERINNGYYICNLVYCIFTLFFVWLLYPAFVYHPKRKST